LQKSFLSLEDARLLSISSQGLCHPIGIGLKAAERTVQMLGYVQIDTLSVASRAHHHVLYNRVNGYKEPMLADLLQQKKVFEYWSHAASYLPMSEFRFSLPLKKSYADGGSHWFAQDKKMKKLVLQRIEREGPLQSKDFEFKREGAGNWYEWKPAKKALEQLFMEGKLMVASRNNFQKVYDLAERVLPEDIDKTMPSKTEHAEFLISKAIRSHGFAELAEIAYLRKGMAPLLKATLIDMEKVGNVVPLKIQGQDSEFFTTPDILKSLQKIKCGKENLQILSPFDNLVIQRKRLKKIFDFDYVIECYFPEEKRVFGYFCLPVLFGSGFAGRFDPKADRSEGVFYVKRMHFEKGFRPGEEFNKRFADKLRGYALFNGCKDVRILEANGKWKKEMNKLF
jgi:uncharacterized protein YcaQ